MQVVSTHYTLPSLMHSAPADRFAVRTQTDELSFRIPMERVALGPIPNNRFHQDPRRYLVNFGANSRSSTLILTTI